MAFVSEKKSADQKEEGIQSMMSEQGDNEREGGRRRDGCFLSDTLSHSERKGRALGVFFGARRGPSETPWHDPLIFLLLLFGPLSPTCGFTSKHYYFSVCL
mmetsp:Transcript_8573/g.16849  ORF Transcript_8573/g.16849 Transcript_8573/m.16849 type:complete len:101 (+) Transcript_8573:1694-1996(+)